MTDAVDNIVILGAGQAGATVAFGLRRAGFTGAVTLVGNEAHLPYERPQLSKEMLLQDDRPLRAMKSLDDYRGQSIDLRLGRSAVNVDADAGRVRLDDGAELAFDRLVVATGTRPRTLPTALAGRDGVIGLRTVEDADALRGALVRGESLAIIGGGVIGLEVASAARARGCPVTVIEAGERLMARSVDPAVSGFLDRHHRRAGIDIRYRTTVEGCDPQGRLRLSNGDVLAADRVLLGIGVDANLQGLDHLGIADPCGVRVDAHGRTAIARIFATGDVASQPIGDRHGRVETWANAQNHALAVVANLLGGSTRYQAPPWFWSDQGDLNLQVVGDAQAGEQVVRGDLGGDRFSVFRLAADGQVTGATTVNSPKDMAVARRWVSDGACVDRARLADPAIALRDCLA